MNALSRAVERMRKFFAPCPAAPAVFRQAVNATRGTAVARNLELASTGEARRRGLLGRNGFAEGEGLWIAPCESVHTFFMRFAIDLIYLDRQLCVKKVRSNVGPWRLSGCFSAHSVLELPVGTISASRTVRGDTLEILTTLSGPDA